MFSVCFALFIRSSLFKMTFYKVYLVNVISSENEKLGTFLRKHTRSTMLPHCEVNKTHLNYSNVVDIGTHMHFPKLGLPSQVEPLGLEGLTIWPPN